jgi:hydroxypyruvate isomerase
MYFWSDLPLGRQCEEIRKAGFEAIEFLFPYQVPLAELKSAVSDADLAISLIDVLPGDIAKREISAAIDPRRSGEFRRNAELALKYALELGVRKINCLSGISGAVPDVSVARQLQTYTENIAWLCDQSASTGIDILVEPISPVTIPAYLFPDLHKAADFIQSMAKPNLALQFDVFHVQMTMGNLVNNIDRYLGIIKYFQFAGAPGRNEPDSGEIDYRYILRYLREKKWQGYIGLEYVPSRPMDSTFSWMADWKDDV